jgi:hypothetical protein
LASHQIKTPISTEAANKSMAKPSQNPLTACAPNCHERISWRVSGSKSPENLDYALNTISIADDIHKGKSRPKGRPSSKLSLRIVTVYATGSSKRGFLRRLKAA